MIGVHGKINGVSFKIQYLSLLIVCLLLVVCLWLLVKKIDPIVDLPFWGTVASLLTVFFSSGIRSMEDSSSG